MDPKKQLTDLQRHAWLLEGDLRILQMLHLLESHASLGPDARDAIAQIERCTAALREPLAHLQRAVRRLRVIRGDLTDG